MISKKTIKLLIISLIMFTVSVITVFGLLVNNNNEVSIKQQKATTVKMSAPEQAQATDNIATGTSGTCSWLIDKDGLLVIWPTNDVSGVLGDINSSTGSPWYDYSEQITEVKFENGVKSGASSCRALFYNCTNIKSIDLGNFDTSQANTMNRMFMNCSSLQSLDFSSCENFVTDNVTDMNRTFYGCKNLINLDLSSFNTTNVTTMEGMMYSSGIKNLNIKGSNFKSTSITNMKQMFGNPSKISIGNFDFKMSDLSVEGYPWGRGSWKKEEDGEIYTAVELALNSSSADISGTYTKVSDISDLLSFRESVDFQIVKFNGIDVENDFETNMNVGGTKKVDIVTLDTGAQEVYLNVPLDSADRMYSFDNDDYVKVILRDAVIDANKEKYDLEITINNLYLSELDTYLDNNNELKNNAIFVPMIFANTAIRCCDYFYDSVENIGGTAIGGKINNDTSNIRFDTTIRILNKDQSTTDGSFIFSVYDLDITDRESATITTYDSPYSEGIELKNGFYEGTLTKMPIDDSCNRLKIINSFNPPSFTRDTSIARTRISGLATDNNSELTEVIVKASSNETTFAWTAGQQCATTLLSLYQPEIVEIDKIDDENNSVSDATLRIEYSDGEEVDTWTTDGTTHRLFLNPGQYILKETNVPDGYIRANDIRFFVESGKITVNSEDVEKIEMTDTRRSDLSYTVNYLEKGTDAILATAKTENRQTFGTVINSDDEKIDITGYDYDSVSDDTITIGTGENVINIYYTKNKYDYRIEYYYNNVIDENNTVTGNDDYNKLIETYPDKIKPGYKFNRVENLPLSISENSDDNVIKVYYIPDEDELKTITYTVEYYKDGEKVIQDTQTVSDTVQVLQNTIPVNKDEINTVDKYPGYVLEETEPETIPDNAEDGDVIKVKYVKRTDLIYTVNYLEKGTNAVIEDAKTVHGQTLGTIINSENEIIEIPGYDYDSISDDTITIGTGENVINIYYTKKDAKLIVEYKEKRSDEPLINNKENEGKFFDEYNLNNYIEDIDGYTLVEMPDPMTVKLEHETEVRTFYYLKNTKVIVNYIDRETGEKLDDDEIPGKSGDTITTYPKEFDEYVLVERPENENIEMTDDVITVNYYYAKISAGVTEKHIDIKTNELLDTKTYEGHEGDPYTTSEKDIEGYDLVEEEYPENSSGKMTVEPIEVKYYYIRKAKVIVEYIDKKTNEKLEEKVKQDDGTYIKKDSTEQINGHEDEKYTTKEKTFEKYKLVEVPENKSGKMKVTIKDDGTVDNTIYVRYYYAPEAEKVVEKHIDINTGKEIETENIYEGFEGDPYNTSRKEIPGYDLVEVPENAEGIMDGEEIEVKYYYIKKAEVKVRYIDKETGKEIVQNTVINGHVNDSYKAEKKDLSNYELIKEEYPKNETGKMTDSPITVTYYYKKIAIPADNNQKNAEQVISNNETSNKPTTVIPTTVTPGTTTTSSGTTSSGGKTITATPNGTTTSSSSSTDKTTATSSTVKAGDNIPVISLGIIGIVIILNIIQNVVIIKKKK